MFEKFVDKAFHRSSLKIIEQANSIIDEYQAAGFSLTLRQLYYQFVDRDNLDRLTMFALGEEVELRRVLAR